MRKAPGSSASGRCFPVRHRPPPVRAAPRCVARGPRRPSHGAARGGDKGRSGGGEARRAGGCALKPFGNSPIPERRSGERMARDLPCQATSIQSVLFTEGPVEAGREVADVEQPTSPSVAPSQDTLRGLPRSGKPGSGTGARFAPIATTPYASSATAPRSTGPVAPAQGAGDPARPALIVFAAGSRP